MRDLHNRIASLEKKIARLEKEDDTDFIKRHEFTLSEKNNKEVALEVYTYFLPILLKQLV